MTSRPLSCKELMTDGHGSFVPVVVPDPRVHPSVLLLTAERCDVEQIVGVEEEIQPALIRRVRVKDTPAVPQEHAEARQLAFREPDLGRAVERRRALVVVILAA